MRGNDLYAWNGAVAVDRGYTPNGLNEYSVVGGIAFTHDANGNLTSDGPNTYGYDVENRLVGFSNGGNPAALRYDPLGRLYELMLPAWGFRWLYDGDNMVAEYNPANGGMYSRFVHGSSAGDDPLVYFNSSSVATAPPRTPSTGFLLAWSVRPGRAGPGRTGVRGISPRACCRCPECGCAWSLPRLRAVRREARRRCRRAARAGHGAPPA